MSIFLNLVAVIAFVALIIGLIKPAWVLPFFHVEKRTRLKVLAIYSAVYFLAVLSMPPAPKTDETDDYLANLQQEAKMADKEQEKKQAEAPKPSVTNKRPKVTSDQIVEVTQELTDLYNQLLLFKDDPAFHQMGFGTGLSYTHNWLKRIEKLNDTVTTKNGYPMSLSICAGDLLQLGKEYMRSKGTENKYTRDFRKLVEDGLAKQ